MTRIRPSSGLHTVIVTVDADEKHIPLLESHARRGLEWFGDYEGFIGGALHKSSDGRRLIQYLQWQSEQQHLDCMQDPAWDENASTQSFLALMKSGEAKVDVRSYEVIAASTPS